jgi:hypothetical protein
LTRGNELTISVDCVTVEQGSGMKRILEWADWVLNPFAWIASLVGKGVNGLSKDYRDDPVYKKNVQRLIDQNRRFEETKE